MLLWTVLGTVLDFPEHGGCIKTVYRQIIWIFHHYHYVCVQGEKGGVTYVSVCVLRGPVILVNKWGRGRSVWVCPGEGVE